MRCDFYIGTVKPPQKMTKTDGGGFVLAVFKCWIIINRFQAVFFFHGKPFKKNFHGNCTSPTTLSNLWEDQLRILLLQRLNDNLDVSYEVTGTIVELCHSFIHRIKIISKSLEEESSIWPGVQQNSDDGRAGLLCCLWWPIYNLSLLSVTKCGTYTHHHH